MTHDDVKVEIFNGVWETSPGPGESVYHATVFHTNSSGNRSPNGFTFHGPSDAVPEALKSLAAAKWAEILRGKEGKAEAV